MAPDKRNLYAGGAIVLIALLFLAFRVRTNTIIHNVKPTDINVGVNAPANYVLPPIAIPNAGGAWDWMQTTDLGCGCDVGLWQQPQEIAPATALPVSYPVYKYVVQNSMAPAPNFDFPIYTAPPLPTFWYEWGYNVHHEQAMYVFTSTGISGTLGKYSRSSYMSGGREFPQQTKNVVRNGDDAYIDGKHYLHDPSRDQTRPAAVATQGWVGN